MDDMEFTAWGERRIGQDEEARGSGRNTDGKAYALRAV